jgi:hypothetical protein
LGFGIPVEVCYVSEKGKVANKKRTRRHVDKVKEENAKKARIQVVESDQDHEVVYESEDE